MRKPRHRPRRPVRPRSPDRVGQSTLDRPIPRPAGSGRCAARRNATAASSLEAGLELRIEVVGDGGALAITARPTEVIGGRRVSRAAVTTRRLPRGGALRRSPASSPHPDLVDQVRAVVERAKRQGFRGESARCRRDLVARRSPGRRASSPRRDRLSSRTSVVRGLEPRSDRRSWDCRARSSASTPGPTARAPGAGSRCRDEDTRIHGIHSPGPRCARRLTPVGQRLAPGAGDTPSDRLRARPERRGSLTPVRRRGNTRPHARTSRQRSL